ncbi:MAG: hypothetical protein GXO79_11450 [Chlorobi bacterium]|nr:hypothetical protein [Chlorobiota bacterium]
MTERIVSLLIDIYYVDLKKNKIYSLSDLARYLKISGSNSNFILVKNILIETHILKVLKKNATNYIITDINKQRLKEFIPEVTLIRKIHDYIRKTENRVIWKYDDHSKNKDLILFKEKINGSR